MYRRCKSLFNIFEHELFIKQELQCNLRNPKEASLCSLSLLPNRTTFILISTYNINQPIVTKIKIFLEKFLELPWLQ